MNRKLWLVIGFGLSFALLAVCGGAMKVARGYLDRSGRTIAEVISSRPLPFTEEASFHFASTDAIDLSDQQKIIVEEFGWPQTFTIMEFESPGGVPGRYELWNYYDGETAYTFLDGSFQFSEPVEPLEGTVILIPYQPDQFPLGITSEVLRESLPGREWVLMPGTDAFQEGVKIFVNEQLLVGFYENRLIFIDAYGFEESGGGS